MGIVVRFLPLRKTKIEEPKLKFCEPDKDKKLYVSLDLGALISSPAPLSLIEKCAREELESCGLSCYCTDPCRNLQIYTVSKTPKDHPILGIIWKKCTRDGTEIKEISE